MATSTSGVCMPADVVMQAVLSCSSISSDHSLRSNFASATSLRVCLTAANPDHVLVSSNLLQEGTVTFAPIRAAASCARATVREGQPAVVCGDERVAGYSDLAVAARSDACAAFFCVPLFGEPSGGGSSSAEASPPSAGDVASVLLGFPSDVDFTEGDLRSGLLLAQALGGHHAVELQSLSQIVGTVLRPSSSAHPQWGDAAGLLRQAPPPGPTTGSDDVSDGVSELGEVVLDPAQHALLQRLHRWTLAFPDPVVEASFCSWRSARMVRVDLAALTTLLAYHITSALLLPTPTARAGAGQGVAVDWLPCLALLLPLMLIASVDLRGAWYVRHRDAVLGWLYAALASYHVLAVQPNLLLQQAAGGAGAGERGGLLWCLEAGWLAVLGMVLQVTYQWQIALLVGAMAVAVGVSVRAPVGAAQLAPAFLLHLLGPGHAALVGVALKVAVPAVLLYRLELGARRAFCGSATGSAWAWQ